MSVDHHVTSSTSYWIYPAQEPAPRGVKLSLLTKGLIQVTGVWNDSGNYIAWQRLHRRIKEQEQ
jgi:hypothetical protein